MSDPAQLDALRAEIDRLDAAMHDALMRRAEVVAQVARVKRASSGTIGTALRPDREAAMARAFDARHSGAFPAHSLHRIWREIVGALTQAQVPFTVHLGGQGAALRDGARYGFGNASDLQVHATALQALKAAGERESDIALLPLADTAWWDALPKRAGVLMRIGDAVVIGPRMDLDWDVALGVIAGVSVEAGETLATAQDLSLVAGSPAALDRHGAIRHIGGYMHGPWVGFPEPARPDDTAGHDA